MTEVELAKRLHRLERDNRRLKVLSVVMLGMLLLVVSVVLTEPARAVTRSAREEISVRSISFVDKTGKSRMFMGVEGEFGTPEIQLYDPHGSPRVDIALGYAAGDPSIELSDSQGYVMELGHPLASALSGKAQKISAASITMLRTPKTRIPVVIWKAPPDKP